MSGGNDISRDRRRNTEFSSLPVVRFSSRGWQLPVFAIPSIPLRAHSDSSSSRITVHARRLFCVCLIPGK